MVSSGYSHNEFLANFANFGFQAVLTKLFKLEELASTLHQLLNSGPSFPLQSTS